MLDQPAAWLASLAFQISQPESLTAAAVDRVAAMFRSPQDDPKMLRDAGQVMNFLISSPLAEHALGELITLLRETGLNPLAYETLVRSLGYAVAWRRPLLDADQLADLAALDHLRPHRRFLLEAILEPCLFRAPHPDRLAEASPYCRYYLGQAVDFQLHAEVARNLREMPRRVLMIHNIADGQGDEILRCVPLVQALLDYNPQLNITLLTRRTYLYSHPRVTAVDIRTAFSFDPPYDAILDFFESNILQLNYDVAVETRLQRLLREHPPFLLVCSAKAHNHFVYDRLEIAGRPLAETLGLNRRRVPKNYETAFRLMAELGLPVRIGENPPLSEPVLAGLAWAEAEAAWTKLTAPNTDRRPVAMLLPYGGSDPLKGHTRPEGVAAEIRRLIARGFFVVLTPAAEPWASVAHAQEALALLPASERFCVTLGPDPTWIPDRDLPDRDLQGRMLLYHIRSADTIVAVEGWMIHAAYCLGKPYEILMHAYSQPGEWHPYGATARQEVTQTSEQPRKLARMFWLARARDPQDLAPLRAALEEPDRDIREAAARGLHNYPLAEVRASATALLEDPAPPVRAAAAEVLLRENVPAPQRAVLKAHLLIGRQPLDWQAVFYLGTDARPALEIAVRSDDPVVRREAVHALGVLNRVQLASTPPASRGARRKSRFRLPFRRRKSSASKILILTPVKDAAGCLPAYRANLMKLTYPHDSISLGFLESDSADSTYRDLEQVLPALRREFRRAQLWKQDFGYRLPPDVPRWAQELQVARRTVLAKSRNHLLFRALDDEDWVLWLDVDVVEYPSDVLERLLAAGKDIVHPHCVKTFGGPSFDRNAWRDQGRLHLDDLRAEGALVKLDAVGGAMLLVRADLHREGLIFPPYPYGRPNSRIRTDTPELETEGLGLLAQDMGYQCWGMPYLEIRHRDR